MPTAQSLLEEQFIEELIGLKSQRRVDIRDRCMPEKDFRAKPQDLDHVHLTDDEFDRLLLDIATLDVFTAARIFRERNSFTRDDGTLLSYTLVNIADWCKNTFEIVNRLRINTDRSYRWHDVVLLINGMPCAQIELKTLGSIHAGRWSRASNTRMATERESDLSSRCCD